jgi:hypothetical protein
MEIKLPTNWYKEGCNIAYQTIYLMKAYNIPIAHVVNSDQIGVHFIPIA